MNYIDILFVATMVIAAGYIIMINSRIKQIMANTEDLYDLIVDRDRIKRVKQELKLRNKNDND